MAALGRSQIPQQWRPVNGCESKSLICMAKLLLTSCHDGTNVINVFGFYAEKNDTSVE
jgi:hypothetical protein